MKFYFRITSIIKYINWCIVFNGFNKPYITPATSIRSNLSFKEINI